MVFLSVLIAIYISYSLFEVHRIIVISYDTNLKDLDILAGQNLLFMDTERLEKDLLVKNMVIKKIRLEKRYVNTIIVQTELRIPLVHVVSGNVMGDVDSSGIYTLDAFNSDLPTIQAGGIPIYKDQKADWRIQKSVDMIVDLNKAGLTVRKIEINNNENYFTAYMKDDSIVMVPFTADVLSVAASLQVIISRFRIEGKFVSKVDFRFDKPIVVLSNGDNIYSK
ncbi:hypothetical protein M1271_04885 [Patescibacteria group bacterium]|nr:hypothetical protein [Patescibacteria group bacterium]